MKKMTFKKVLFSAALLASAAVQAQDNPITFVRDMTFREVYGWANSKCTPHIGDFDNDGINDLWLDGQRQSYGWQTRTVFAKGLGDRQFLADYEPVMETHYDTTYQARIDTIYAMDENGDYLLDGEGNKIVEELLPILDDKGNPVNDTIVTSTENYICTVNGLPQTAWSVGSQPIDFNCDGLVDYLILHPGNVGDLQGYILVKNLGGGKFEVVPDETLASIKFSENPKKGDYNNFNEFSAFSSVVVGDYDKDGYPDILMTGRSYEDRYVKLLRNVNGERFEDMKVFEALPFDVEVNRYGLWEKSPGGTDPETGDPIESAYYQDQPTRQAKPLSHGSVVFMDMDNDGWLDIVVSGYADGTDMSDVGSEPSGDEIRFYHNQQDGTFKDVTDQFIPAAGEALTAMGIEPVGTLEDVFTAWGTNNTVMLATDYNQDGLMDLLITGKKRVDVHNTFALINVPEEGKVFGFYEETTPLIGATDTGSRGFFYADFNGDDVPDLYRRGYSDYKKADGSAWSWFRSFEVSQGTPGAYSIHDLGYWSNDVFGGFTWIWEDGSDPICCNFGDVDNDGKLDLMAGAYEGGTDNFIISYNETPFEPVVPEAPADVTATEGEDGNITVTWTPSYLSNGNVAIHNVYIRNNETGALRMLVPANVETGKQLSYAMYGAYATNFSVDEGVGTYTFEKLPAGTYTVGVQAVNYAFLGSEFATTEVTLNNGWSSVEGVKAQAEVKVSVEGDVLTVESTEDVPVAVYNAQGAQVAAGAANAPMTVRGSGVFIVKAGTQVAKIVK